MSSRPAWTEDETLPLKINKWDIFPMPVNISPCQPKAVHIFVHQSENSVWSFLSPVPFHPGMSAQPLKYTEASHFPSPFEGLTTQPLNY